MVVETKLLWNKKGDTPIGSIRLEKKEYNTETQVIVPYETDHGTLDFIVVDVVKLVNAVGQQMIKKMEGEK